MREIYILNIRLNKLKFLDASSGKVMKISVLVAVYNVEQYLKSCLDSLLNQTLKNCEFIVIDDASTDKSRIICDEYAEKDSRFIIVHKTRNEGLLLSRRTAINLAQGEWIVFVDGDDFLPESNTLETILSIVESQNADIIKFDVEVVGGSDVSRETMKQFLAGKGEGQTYLGSVEISDRCYCQRMFSWSLWNKVYRSSVVKKACQNYESNYFNAAEDAYQFFLFCYFSNVLKTIKTKPLYCYRLGSGLTTRQTSIDQFEGYAKEILAAQWIENFLKRRNDYDRFSRQVKTLKETLMNTVIKRYLCLSDKDKKLAYQTLKKYYTSNDIDQIINDESRSEKKTSKLFRWLSNLLHR